MDFIFTLITTSTIASLFNLFGSRRPRQRLRVREAIAVVGCGWLLVCLMGALPYLFLNPADPIAAVLKVFPVFLLPVLLPHFLLTIFRPASVSGVA